MLEEIRIHKGYQLFGKYQHIFSSEKGKISLIRLKKYYSEKVSFWEIYCLEGNLFEDTERFKIKVKAVKRIKELLE